MSRFDVVKGVNVLEDWDNFLWNKLQDYYTVQEKILGEYFTISEGTLTLERDDEGVKKLVADSNLCKVMKTIRNRVATFVIVGKDVGDNPYKLEENKIFLVGVYNTQTNMELGVVELAKFVDTINVNSYGVKYELAQIMGVADFKGAVKEIKNLPEDGNTDEVESQIISNFDVLLQSPSGVNPELPKNGVTFFGMFGYTFFYKK